MERSKQYTDADGMWLDVGVTGHEYYIAWYDDDDEGARVGERDDGADNKLSIATLKPLVNGDSIRREDGVFVFDREKDAIKALAMLNAALLAAKAGRPWPAWALEAKAAGWTPPKGWTP